MPLQTTFTAKGSSAAASTGGLLLAPPRSSSRIPIFGGLSVHPTIPIPGQSSDYVSTEKPGMISSLFGMKVMGVPVVLLAGGGLLLYFLVLRK